MKDQEASQSAAITAAHRAFESEKPEKDRICYDPYARQFIGPGYTVIGKADFPQEVALQLFSQVVPGFHEFFLSRTRYIDDSLDAYLNKGLDQLVVLGAGYDSRAYRFDKLKQLRVFEVDHPATQAHKKDRVLAIFQSLPEHVTYLSVDFGKQDLESSLVNNGYDPSLQTLFIWEGVSMYVDASTVDQTLSVISGNTAPGSAVIFDYTSPEVIKGVHERPEAKGWYEKAASSSEPLLFGIDDNKLESFLKRRGFVSITQIDHTEFKKAYFADQDRNATPILAIAHARVGREAE